MKCIDFDLGPIMPQTQKSIDEEGGTREELVRCKYFVINRRVVSDPMPVGSHERFTALMGLQGDAVVRSQGVEYALGTGQTLLLPAEAGECTLISSTNPAPVLECFVP
jgi:mannose-6-phosphate isomerase class I